MTDDDDFPDIVVNMDDDPPVGGEPIEDVETTEIAIPWDHCVWDAVVEEAQHLLGDEFMDTYITAVDVEQADSTSTHCSEAEVTSGFFGGNELLSIAKESLETHYEGDLPDSDHYQVVGIDVETYSHSTLTIEYW